MGRKNHANIMAGAYTFSNVNSLTFPYRNLLLCVSLPWHWEVAYYVTLYILISHYIYPYSSYCSSYFILQLIGEVLSVLCLVS